ncbi:MAG: hypothetical protein IJP26_01535 [Clostridia bacterium]|nr:hypothetical protein [Clostridia bacterium]
MEKNIDYYIKQMQNYKKLSKFNDSLEEKVVPALNNNNDKYAQGILKISVTHSKGTFPVPNASYFVYDNGGLTVADGQTDESGISPEITLPSLPTNITQTPGTDFAKSAVFYNALVTAENFIDLKINNIPIFENIKTIQNFDLTFLGALENQETQIINLPNQNTL